MYHPSAGRPLPRQKRAKNLHPQSALSRFWYRFHSRTPGKTTAIFPRELYKNIASGGDEPHANRSNAAQSYEKAKAECKAKVRAAVNQCERTNSRFCDSEYNIETDFYSGEYNCLMSLTGTEYDSDYSSSSSDDDEAGHSRRKRPPPPPGTRKLRQSLQTLQDSNLLARQEVTVDVYNLDRYLNQAPTPVRYHRPSRSLPKSVHRLDWIFDNPRFTVDGFSSSDIKQGGVGDCWWLAAVGNIAHRRDLMERICVARDEECGVYGFVFHRDGEWVSTVIDDNLYLSQEDFGLNSDVYDVSGKKARKYRQQKQTGSEALYFAKCEDENETWLPLLEKAYAKIHGDYMAIEGGWAGSAVEDLTGGVTTMLLGNCVLRKDKLWREMLGLDETHSEFVFALSASGDTGASRKNGLVLRHAYSILKATEIVDASGNKQRLLKVRNPWGQRSDAGFGVWHGPWSDGSKEWTPENLKKLRHEFADNGTFWMSFEDVLGNFKWIHRTRLFDERWTVAQQWLSTSISWVPGFLKSKFVVDLKKEGLVVIVLSNLDQRYFQGLEGTYSFTLEFRLKRVGSDSIDFIASANKINSSIDVRSVNCEVHLPAGTYEVTPRVTATHCPWKQPVEQVVQQQVTKNPAKLREVGLRYDLAHAKAGVLDEDASQRQKRQRARAKAKKRQVRNDGPDPRDFLEHCVQQIVSSVHHMLVSNRHIVREDEMEKAVMAPRLPEPSGERSDPAPCEDTAGEQIRTPPGFWPDEPGPDPKDKPEKTAGPDEPASLRRSTSKLEQEGRTIADPEKPTKDSEPKPEPHPESQPVPETEPAPMDLPAPVDDKQVNIQPRAEHRAIVDNHSRSISDQSELDSDTWSDSDSEMDGAEPRRRWNPVCVMCLRVYAQDKDVSVRLVESKDTVTEEPDLQPIAATEAGLS